MAWASGSELAGSVHVEALDVGYEGRRVLSGVTIACEPGQCCAIVGVNGAGKSTLLSVMAGVASGRSGVVRIDGVEVVSGGSREVSRLRAYMEQGEQLAFEYTVAEVVRMGEYAWRGGWAPGDVGGSGRVAGYLERVGLSGYAQRSVMTLSGGERRRVMLARVMATRAGWWMLDEPLSSLDLKYQGEVMDAVSEHCARGGGVVMVCHDMNWVMARCQRVVVCHDGGVLAQGAPAEVLTQALIRDVFGVEAYGVDVRGARRWVHQL